MTTVIIPAYQPDAKMLDLICELKKHELEVIIIDDGSKEKYADIFTKASEYGKVIHLEQNGGKGAALKKGFNSLREIYPDCDNFITADADGQHSVKDILRVKKELDEGAQFVLTVRNLSGKIPPKSKIGNNLSRWVYTLLTGHYFPDNQSGLRGFSVDNIEWLTKVRGEKYDYEMNMLYCADKQSIPITTISIETIYIDGNKSSHFDPIKDTLRIYKLLFSSAWASFAGFILLEILMLISSLLYGYDYIHITLHSSMMASVLLSILLNRFLIFKDFNYSDGRRSFLRAILKSLVFFAGCILIKHYIPRLPLFAAFNLFYLISLPVEYLLFKLNRLAKYNDINKEQK